MLYIPSVYHNVKFVEDIKCSAFVNYCQELHCNDLQLIGLYYIYSLCLTFRKVAKVMYCFHSKA